MKSTIKNQKSTIGLRHKPMPLRGKESLTSVSDGTYAKNLPYVSARSGTGRYDLVTGRTFPCDSVHFGTPANELERVGAVRGSYPYPGNTCPPILKTLATKCLAKDLTARAERSELSLTTCGVWMSLGRGTRPEAPDALLALVEQVEQVE